jgi:hypothetical protein
MNKLGTIVATGLCILAGAAGGVRGEVAGESGGMPGEGAMEKTRDVRKLVHVFSGKQMKDMVDNVMKSALEAARKQDPKADLSESSFKDLFTESDFETVMEKMVPVYEKHFTHAEIRDILAFYESPAGKKMHSELPQMMQEIMPELMAWAKQVSERVKQRVDEATAKKGDDKPKTGGKSAGEKGQ